MSFETEILARLVAQSVGVVDTNIFVGSKSAVPDGPGPFLTFRDTGGFAPERTQNTIYPPAYVKPSAQLLARAFDKPAARTMIYAAYAALISVRNQLLSGTFYREINPRQEPYDLGLDSKGRVQYVFNIDVIKRPS